MAKFDPSQIRDPFSDRQKIETLDYVRETTPVSNLVQIRPLGASWQAGDKVE